MIQTIKPRILYFGTPVVLISTQNADGTANLAPISSVWWLAMTAVIGLDTRCHTVANLAHRGQCVLNLPSVDLVHHVDRLALTTGSCPVPQYKREMGFRHVRDKFAEAGLTEIPSEAVSPPRAKECPVQLECKLRDITRIGAPSERSASIELQVVRTHAHEAILKPGHRNHIDPDKWRPLMMNFLEFYGLGERANSSRLADVF